MHKYTKVLDFGYTKYLDVIYNCDGIAMYKQMTSLVEKFDGENKNDESNRKYSLNLIKELTDLGFIETYQINQNKFLHLKKPAFAIVTGDYNTSSRVTLAKDLKNDKFRIAILKLEYFIEHNSLISNKNMLYHLKVITRQIKNLILKTENKYNYSLESIDEILKINDFVKVKYYLEEHPEYMYKLDVVRVLWGQLGDLYRKMLLQRETVDLQPEYLKTFVLPSGQVILHYIPNILIFDVSKDKKFFKDKSAKLFEAFYRLQGNALRGIYNSYVKNQGSSMGYEGEHHIGYKITLIGEDIDVLNEKKSVLDESMGNLNDTPIMDFTSVIALSTGEYLYHASRKGNKFSQAHNERIDRLIAQKLNELEIRKIKERKSILEKENEDFAKDLFNLVKNS